MPALLFIEKHCMSISATVSPLKTFQSNPRHFTSAYKILTSLADKGSTLSPVGRVSDLVAGWNLNMGAAVCP